MPPKKKPKLDVSGPGVFGRVFNLRQRNAQVGALREIIGVGNVNHILFNGNHYDYILYILGLILETARTNLRIYRCPDGSNADDVSTEWKELHPKEVIKFGYHVFECTSGMPLPWDLANSRHHSGCFR
jgi:hypothetical protein